MTNPPPIRWGKQPSLAKPQGYVGYFCLAAGIGQGAGVQIGSFSSWLGLFTRGGEARRAARPALAERTAGLAARWLGWRAGRGLGTPLLTSPQKSADKPPHPPSNPILPSDALTKLVPTLASAAALFLTMTRARSPFALPAVLVALPLAFYAVLLATGTSLAEAQDLGWALKPQVRDALHGRGRASCFAGFAPALCRAVCAPAVVLAGRPGLDTTDTLLRPTLHQSLYNPNRHTQPAPPNPQGKSTQQFWELYEMFNIRSWRLDGVYLPALAR
jgi:hypothetical protein